MTVAAESGGEIAKCEGCDRIVLWLDGLTPCEKCEKPVSVLLAAPVRRGRSTALVVMGGSVPTDAESPRLRRK
ncbi:hypothetical protein CK936_35935 [Streptomyces albireticuli]|uniref:Uncharacterized protein n=1 Tax=Streptomyces albireticuli TaxID=1940 RepID=A0A2A2CY98_9ACTN|nr:hypothetical protein CK936_35935 [Streptomyces albireticuli]